MNKKDAWCFPPLFVASVDSCVYTHSLTSLQGIDSLVMHVANYNQCGSLSSWFSDVLMFLVKFIGSLLGLLLCDLKTKVFFIIL